MKTNDLGSKEEGFAVRQRQHFELKQGISLISASSYAQHSMPLMPRVVPAFRGAVELAAPLRALNKRHVVARA
jgi:hypothetical protein